MVSTLVGPNILRNGNFSCLHKSVSTGNKELVAPLVEYGAKAKMRSSVFPASGPLDDTPIKLAEKKGYTEISNMLMAAKAHDRVNERMSA